jgi:hypothetical protein
MAPDRASKTKSVSGLEERYNKRGFGSRKIRESKGGGAPAGRAKPPGGGTMLIGNLPAGRG